ncbi:MAG: fimbrillin family protein [Bacteroidales bacterium]|nr:fimbrillin family protein [Bacteroidales bacterium]
MFCFVAAICGVISCNVGSYSPDIATGNGPVTLGFGIAGGSSTKTSVNDDGKSVSWSDGDKVRLWAVNSSGATVIDAHPFTMLGSFGNEAIFTAQFANPMPEDTYTYYACYPAPLSSDGDILKFSLPANQDGKASGGADIMISGPVTHGALKPLGKDSSSDFRMSLKHMVHILKFYLPEGSNGLKGEGVRKIKVEMDENVVGTMSVDRTDPSKTPSLTDGGSTIVLSMDEPLTPSYGGTRNYASASICPTPFDDGARMKVTLYSDSWIGTVAPFNVAGRDFKAGHTTSVRLNVLTVDPYYTLNFRFSGNNLGENIQKITFTVDDNSLHLGDDGASSYTFSPGRDIAIGETVTFSYTDVNAYLTLSGHKVTMTYESEHVRSTESLTLPNLESFRSYTYGMTVPYLLFEDFSTVGSFSSYDGYSSGFNSGDKDPISFLNGWTGARIGGQTGTSIRIAPRRETSARYHSRVDSAPLNGSIIKSVNVKVTFDYGMAEQHGGIGSKQYPMLFWVGYVRKAQGYSGNSTTGTFGDENVINETDGSWTYLPNRMNVEMQLPAVDSDNPVNRISIRAEVENHAGANNNTNWLYIDNVKVVVAPK